MGAKEEALQSYGERAAHNQRDQLRNLLGLVVFMEFLTIVAFGWLLIVSLPGLDRNLEKNRSVDCRDLIRSGEELRLDGPCYDSGVLKHYDPKKEQAEAVASQQDLERVGAKSRAVSCEVLHKMGANHPICEEDAARAAGGDRSVP